MRVTTATFCESTGQLYWREYFRTRDMMVKQAEWFEREAQLSDWFAKDALALAQEIRAAIAEHDAYWKERTPTVTLDPDRPF